MRGSPPNCMILRRLYRSIPACAGQPKTPTFVASESVVYPRVCGAATHAASSSSCHHGLSPRVRGSLLRRSLFLLRFRSIPACAGQPGPPQPSWCWRRVYPRVCGAARRVYPQCPPAKGLSPRVRGSRGLPWRKRWESRSIPACAGQPKTSRPTSQVTKVYPRVCGAAKNQQADEPGN